MTEGKTFEELGVREGDTVRLVNDRSRYTSLAAGDEFKVQAQKDGSFVIITNGGKLRGFIDEWQLVSRASDHPYEIDRRYPWSGGKCPVPAGSDVTVWFNDGDLDRDNNPECWDWDNSSIDVFITAFLVHSYPEPDIIDRMFEHENIIIELASALSMTPEQLKDTLRGDE